MAELDDWGELGDWGELVELGSANGSMRGPMSDEFRVNSTWLPMKGRLLVLPDNIDAVAIRVLCGTDFPLPVAPSNLAVHPEEFFDEDEQYDYELIWSCPANLPDFWEDERLRWATNICQRARTDKLRDMDPALLVRKLLYEG